MTIQQEIANDAVNRLFNQDLLTKEEYKALIDFIFSNEKTYPYFRDFWYQSNETPSNPDKWTVTCDNNPNVSTVFKTSSTVK